MDVVWIILDSLSFNATPFHREGPKTMPRLAELANKEAIIFKQAYSPGPTSPSSHGSFFTGELPSTTGMHEASPYFDFSGPTIASELSKTHKTHLISSNQFLFNGLDQDFDNIKRLGVWEPHFSSGTNPMNFNPEREGARKYLEFLFKEGSPFRSLFNGLQYKTEDPWGAAGNFAEEITTYICESALESTEDTFIVANYMNVHPPLAASDESLSLFAKEWVQDELPIGVQGREILEKFRGSDDYSADDMRALYEAAIWDLDRMISPMVSDLIDNDAFVVITADHGASFRREHEYEESRIHIPLLIFTPNRGKTVRTETVNIRSLPKTTMEALNRESDHLNGSDLLTQERSQVSITEFIYNENIGARPVPPTQALIEEDDTEMVKYHMAGIKDSCRIDYDGKHFQGVNSIKDEDIKKMKKVIEETYKDDVNISGTKIKYDTATKERLKELGYL